MKLAVPPQPGVFVADDVMSEEVCYRVKKDRGYPHVENLFSPVKLEANSSLAALRVG
jgi:hypothetical protein